MRKFLPALAGLVALSLPFPTLAQAVASSPPPPLAAQRPPCSGPKFKQLDFWVGEWDLEFDQADGTVGRASNRITRDEFGLCAVVEHFVQPGGGPGGGDYVGSSFSTYDRQLGMWRQMWVDNGGGLFVLTGGPVEGQPYIFELVTTEPRGDDAHAPALARMIWEQVTPDSLVWRWQKGNADGTWSDSWVLRYKRRK